MSTHPWSYAIRPIEHLLDETRVAIDGSKFKPVNHREKNFTHDRLKRRIAAIDESIILIPASALDKVFETGFGPKGDPHTKFVAEGFRALNEAQAAGAERASNEAPPSGSKPPPSPRPRQ